MHHAVADGTLARLLLGAMALAILAWATVQW